MQRDLGPDKEILERTDVARNSIAFRLHSFSLVWPCWPRIDAIRKEVYSPLYDHNRHTEDIESKNRKRFMRLMFVRVFMKEDFVCEMKFSLLFRTY